MAVERQKITNIVSVFLTLLMYSNIVFSGIPDTIYCYVLNSSKNFTKEHIRIVPKFNNLNKDIVNIIDYTQPFSYGVLNNFYLNQDIYSLYRSNSGMLYNKKFYRKYLKGFTSLNLVFYGGMADYNFKQAFLILEKLKKMISLSKKYLKYLKYLIMMK